MGDGGDRSMTVLQYPAGSIRVAATGIVQSGDLQSAIAALAGASTSGVQVNFAYGDANPVLLMTLPAGKTLVQARVIIRVGMDGVGAGVTVGTSADHEAVVAASQLLPDSPGIYETSPALYAGADTSINLYINPGAGPTAGSGTVILYPTL